MRRSTWILLLVFGLLVLFAWLFQRNQANKTVETPTATAIPTAVKVYNLTNLEISALNIIDDKGKQVDLNRNSSTSNNWAIKGVAGDQADKVGIESAISQLLSMKIIDSLAENPPLDSIGLATPLYTITMVTSDGQKIVTDVGIKTPIGTGYYVRVGSGPVIIVDNLTLDPILNFIETPPLLTTPTPELTTPQAGTPIAPDILVSPTP